MLGLTACVFLAAIDQVKLCVPHTRCACELSSPLPNFTFSLDHRRYGVAHDRRAARRRQKLQLGRQVILAAL